jgi:tRNA threonylcarbamoyl adenosine modification protein (Sua5/YciO/YrdC/YwlC family)
VTFPAVVSADPIAAAVVHVLAGGLVAFPTETVWGLGADARSETAMAALRRFKGRSGAQPVSLLVPDLEAAVGLGLDVPPAARRLAALFWPGPLTLVLPGRAGALASGVSRADGAVGLRCSPHPVAAALAHAIARTGSALTATSLNRHGEPPARHRDEAAALCIGNDTPLCIDSEPDAGGAAPSTVVDCTVAPPRVLREGAITAEALAHALGPERVPR